LPLRASTRFSMRWYSSFSMTISVGPQGTAALSMGVRPASSPPKDTAAPGGSERTVATHGAGVTTGTVVTAATGAGATAGAAGNASAGGSTGARAASGASPPHMAYERRTVTSAVAPTVMPMILAVRRSTRAAASRRRPTPPQDRAKDRRARRPAGGGAGRAAMTPSSGGGRAGSASSIGPVVVWRSS
jgi:hypothetical protein